MFTALVLATHLAASPSCAALRRSARPAIEHANADWVRAMRARDAEAIASAYADDGIFVQGDGKTVVGRAAVQALYAEATRRAPSILGGGIHSQGVVCGGDGLLYEWGRGELKLRTADGGEVVRGGPYLTVWKRIGGAWKIVRNLSF